MTRHAFRLGVLVVGLSGMLMPSRAQTPAPSTAGQDAAIAIAGTVVSTAQNSLTVRSDGGLYVVFIFDRYTVKPKSIPLHAKVNVLSSPTGEPGVRIATDITITSQPPGQPGTATREAPESTPSASRTEEPKPYETAETVPVSVRKLEGAIERQSRRYSFGFHTGVGLDPEVLLIGVQARVGPFFSRNLSFRPSVDFGFGEVTKMFAIDLNGIYRIPFNARQSRWSAFVGAGPCLLFEHRNFEEAAAGDNGIDFGQFKFQGGLNILTGVEFRSGLYVEAKTTVYAGPHLRLGVGYSF